MNNSSSPEPVHWGSARKITREQGKIEQRRYSLSLTVEQRLEQLDALNRDLLALRGISLDQLAQDKSVRRVRRSWR